MKHIARLSCEGGTGVARMRSAMSQAARAGSQVAQWTTRSRACQKIAADDLHYSRYGLAGRIWGGFLKVTIGYGHRPMLTIMWSLAVVVIGWLMVRGAQAAAVMRPTYPENALAAGDRRYEHLYPFLYSLDVFLPFVNLHQEHYWWPDADAAGRYKVFGFTLNLRGSVVLYYLWAQIIAGWILSAIFVAGVTEAIDALLKVRG